MWFDLDQIFQLYDKSHSWEGATSGVSRPYVMTCWKCTWSGHTTEHRPHRYNLINNNNHSHHPNWPIKEKITEGDGDGKGSSVVYQGIRKVLLCVITKVDHVTRTFYSLNASTSSNEIFIFVVKSKSGIESCILIPSCTEWILLVCIQDFELAMLSSILNEFHGHHGHLPISIWLRTHLTTLTNQKGFFSFT